MESTKERINSLIERIKVKKEKVKYLEKTNNKRALEVHREQKCAMEAEVRQLKIESILS